MQIVNKSGRLRTPITELPRVSLWLLLFFHRVARRRLSVSFRALRIANNFRASSLAAAPLVVVLNHPSWWDPLVGFVLSRHLFPARHFYAPMDEVALQRYGIFRRLGMFPVALQSPRGAAQFLRTGALVLEAAQILAVTPQGKFTDVRTRPVIFQPGLAALLHRRSAQGKPTTVLPIAVEYTFWDQRLPEVLVNCGEPIRFGAADAPSQPAIHAALEQSMTQTQDELADLALARDPGKFATVLQGRRGSAGFYGWIERFRSVLLGNRRLGDHASGSGAADSHTRSSKG